MASGKNTTDYSTLSMQELFCMEAENQTAILTQGLLDLETGEDAGEKLENLMRASHSLKGAARIVGLESVVNLAHVMEDWFVEAQHKTINISSEQIDLLLRAVDLISNIAKTSEADLEIFIAKKIDYIVNLVQEIANAIRENTVLENTSDLNSPDEQYDTTIKGSLSKYDVENSQFVIGSVVDDTYSVENNEHDSKPERKQNGKVIRVDAIRLNQILGLSSELVVESRWLQPFAKSLQHLKKRQTELSNILENLRDSMFNQGNMSGHDSFQFVSAQRILSDCRNLLSEKLQALDDFDRRNHNLSSRIYKEIISSRMRPFAEATQGLRRMVRDLSRSLNKKINFRVIGNETPVDRDVLENIKSPLVHLLRNAIDHGIEDSDIRRTYGKLDEGELVLSAHHGAGMLTIVVQDDGAGIDLGDIKSKILKRKLATENIVNKLTNDELLEFLFLPEFSTKNNVTEISGRGVGLDVVHKMVMDMHGSIRIESEAHIGSRFILQLPVTLSLVSAIVVSISGENYAFPLSRIVSLHNIEPNEINYIEGKQYFTFNDDNVGLVAASQILGLQNSNFDSNSYAVVVINSRDKNYGVVVDKFIGRRELSVQAIDSRLGKIQDISAGAVTDDGETVLIVDTDDLARSIELFIHNHPNDHLSLSRRNKTLVKTKKILVVDDSLTVREVERKLLMNHGYTVDVAIDGMDGWNAVRRTSYDLVITDVDMPRMDGIELVSLIKKDNRLNRLPIMIVSYKDRYEDRQRGLEVGADYYLTKGSFHDETLIDAVLDLIGEAKE